MEDRDRLSQTFKNLTFAEKNGPTTLLLDFLFSGSIGPFTPTSFQPGLFQKYWTTIHKSIRNPGVITIEIEPFVSKSELNSLHETECLGRLMQGAWSASRQEEVR